MSDPHPIGEAFAQVGSRLAAQQRATAPTDVELAAAADAEERRLREAADRRAAENHRKALEATPTRYRDARPTHPMVAGWARAIANGGTESLLLSGEVGRGKTFQAWGAVHLIRDVAGRRVDNSPEVVTWKCPDLLDALRPGHDRREAVLDSVREAPVLYLDDLGAEKGSEWTSEILYRIMDHRWDWELPTLLTSNVTTADDLGSASARLVSRLFGMCQRVVLDGEDRRQAGPSIRPVPPPA